MRKLKISFPSLCGLQNSLKAFRPKASANLEQNYRSLVSFAVFRAKSNIQRNLLQNTVDNVNKEDRQYVILVLDWHKESDLVNVHFVYKVTPKMGPTKKKCMKRMNDVLKS